MHSIHRRSLRSLGFVGAAAAFCALAPDASAQFNNQWVSFTKQNSRIVTPTVPLTEMSTEVDVDWADLDKDGWTDLVAVRKQDFTSAGKRVNLLLLNKNGVLTDFSQLARFSTVPGDVGFGTPTNDRDVRIIDFDNDGWLDFVIATTLSDGDPKHIGHPRIYMNRGKDANGVWLGMRFENARFPQLFSFSNGQPQNPRFCSFAVGDLTNNGFADLYFGDYDSSGDGGLGQPPGADLNNRLVINDGTGNFSDGTQARLTATAALSAFGAASEIHDMNGDGFNDVVKQTALNPPQHVALHLNNPANPGFFLNDTTQHQVFHTNAPYHITCGDLNNDGRIDIAVSDDAADRYRFNTGTDAFGRVIWSGGGQAGGHPFSFLTGGDDGFASNNLIADLDGDGWNDVLIADVDVDIGGYNRRLHIYHNMITSPTQVPGVIREQRQNSTSTGWIGAPGILNGDLGGTHDIAVFDIDNDGDNDLIILRRTTTEVFMNNTDPVFCQTSLGFAGPGTSTMSICGAPLWKGLSSTLQITGAPANVPAVLGVGVGVTPFPLFGGTLATLPLITIDLFTNPSGQIAIPINATGNPNTFVLQALVLDVTQPELFQFTNAVQLQMH
jgi:hypothetical protein